MFGESKVKQNPFQSQIHSESIKNPTKPWRIYQILHIMIPAIGFQEFTIGMLTPPNKKENFQKFRGVIIRQPTLHILNPALHCIFKCAAHRFDRSFRISTPDLFWLPKLSRREPAQYWPRGLVGKCLECSQQRRSLDTAVRCTLRHAMHKLGYGILIQFDVMYVTQLDSGASVHLQTCAAWVSIVRIEMFRFSMPTERGFWCSSSMHFEACNA